MNMETLFVPWCLLCKAARYRLDEYFGTERGCALDIYDGDFIELTVETTSKTLFSFERMDDARSRHRRRQFWNEDQSATARGFWRVKYILKRGITEDLVKITANVVRLIAAIWISVFWSEVGALTSLYNVTAQRNVERSKRFIIFDGYGILMFISGVALPVILEDKKPWRSVGAVYSLHGQFAQPEEPLYWWDKWEGRSLAEAKRQFNRDGTYIPDESRAFIYALLEHYMNKAGKNGRKCMLRAICEHARVDEVEGIVGEIIHAVLRPADDSDEEYRDAFKAGRYGAICTTMYPECPRGKGLLDNVIVSKLKQFYKDM